MQRRKWGEDEARVAREGRSEKELTPVRKPLLKLFRPRAQPKWLAKHSVNPIACDSRFALASLSQLFAYNTQNITPVLQASNPLDNPWVQYLFTYYFYSIFGVLQIGGS